MACLNKLNKAILFGCAGGSIGISDLILVNKVDVQSIAISSNTVTSIALKSGAKCYSVDCYKNSVKMVDAIRSLDGATGLDQSVTVTVYDKSSDGAAIIEELLNGRFIAFGKLKDGGNVKVAGGIAGLECSASDSDTSANGGFASVTLKTPDGGRGDSPLVANTTVWTYLNNNLISG